MCICVKVKEDFHFLLACMHADHPKDETSKLRQIWFKILGICHLNPINFVILSLK